MPESNDNFILPVSYKNACDAYSGILQAQFRLWNTSVFVATVILLTAYRPSQDADVELMFGLGKVRPVAFFGISTLILSSIWFAQLVQYCHSFRAYDVVKGLADFYSREPIAPCLRLHPYREIFHKSGPAHFEPLLDAWEAPPMVRKFYWLTAENNDVSGLQWLRAFRRWARCS